MNKLIPGIKMFFSSLKARPLLLTPYLIVLLFAANESALLYMQYVLPLWSTIGNIFILLLVAFVVHFFFSLIINDRLLSAIIATYTLFICVYYFDLYMLVYNDVPWIAKHITRGYNVFLLASFAVIGLALWLLLRKLKPQLKYINNYLIIILSIFILIEIGKAFLFEPFDIKYTNLPTDEQLKANPDSCSKPDIYYIIFDSYTASRSLKKYWNYDNPLDTLLRNYGFYLASKSNTNYNATHFSVSSCLNMSYHSQMTEKQEYAIPIIKENALANYSLVADYLKNKGYQIISLSLFDFMGTKNFWNINYAYMAFFDRTIYQLAQVKLGDKKLVNERADKSISFKVMDSVASTAQLPSKQPRFVYAHIYLPHDPFFFDALGNEMPDSYAIGGVEPYKYLEQLKFLNKCISDMLKKMFAKGKSNAIIIIQGDHGYRYLKLPDDDENIRESLSIFNSYYLPSGDYSSLYDSISPVNSFRVILNQTFGTKLPLLPDTSYALYGVKNFRETLP